MLRIGMDRDGVDRIEQSSVHQPLQIVEINLIEAGPVQFLAKSGGMQFLPDDPVIGDEVGVRTPPALIGIGFIDALEGVDPRL